MWRGAGGSNQSCEGAASEESAESEPAAVPEQANAAGAAPADEDLAQVAVPDQHAPLPAALPDAPDAAAAKATLAPESSAQEEQVPAGVATTQPARPAGGSAINGEAAGTNCEADEKVSEVATRLSDGHPATQVSEPSGEGGIDAAASAVEEMGLDSPERAVHSAE